MSNEEPFDESLPDGIELEEDPHQAENEALLDEMYAEAAAEDLARHEQEQEDLYKARRKFISADTIHARTYPGMEYVIGPNILPKRGKLLITAETGVGKSALSLHIAACLATARPLFGLIHRRKDEHYGEAVFPVTRKHYTAYLDYEIPEHQRKLRIDPLFEQFGTLNGRLAFFDKSSDYRLMNVRGEVEGKGSFDRLFADLRMTQPDVLIIDPFSSTHSLNEISNEIKQPLNNIDRIIDHTGCAAILIHHASTKAKTDERGKSVERKIREMPRGHSSILDWCDAHLHVTEIVIGHPSATKTLQLDWGKTRYGRAPMSRQIVVNFETMHVEPFTP